nr:uncharacterized protein LOC109167327 [Ipomoea trifida]
MAQSSSFVNLTHIAPPSRQLKKNGSMLDRDGLLNHSIDPETTKKILKYLEEVGLMKYVCHDYKTGHPLDETDFFANTRLKDKKGEIHSIVSGTEIVIVHGDIRALFDFLVWEGEHPDCSGHAYNQEDLWKEVKGYEAPEELKISFEKKTLKLEFERMVEILSKIVENRMAAEQ